MNNISQARKFDQKTFEIYLISQADAVGMAWGNKIDFIVRDNSMFGFLIAVYVTGEYNVIYILFTMRVFEKRRVIDVYPFLLANFATANSSGVRLVIKYYILSTLDRCKVYWVGVEWLGSIPKIL